MSNQNFSAEESLQVITEMIYKVKTSFHEKGTSAILWGTVTAIAGLTSFAQFYFNFNIGFDIWLLVLAAVIPQVYISIKEGKQRKYSTHQQKAIDAVWIVYGISIGCYIFYINVVPAVSAEFFMEEHPEAIATQFPKYIYSVASVFLILYALPTLATGLIANFKPMLAGGIICYLLFFVSCYSSSGWDMLLLGIAGIINWLIPGVILRNRYLKSQENNV